MKGATHNLVVRTRNDVALYVLNHKRGHLRDLENAFKVTLSIVSDPNVGGLQSYIIDRGEQVHTLEAAKALLAAQAAATPIASEEASDEDEAFDAEFESEVETEETEGLAEDAGAEAAESEGEQEGQGQRRKRRRRRRGRGSGGEAREASQPREDGEVPLGEQAPSADAADERESEEEDSEEQRGLSRDDNQGSGERRPRRRGRRGGRRRRGNGDHPEDGLSGSISDELAPPSASEVTDAVADFDGGAPPAPSLSEVHPEPHPTLPETVSAPASEPVAHEDEKHVARRSTVREKVSFASSHGPAAEAPDSVTHAAPEPAPAAEAAPAAGAEPTPEASSNPARKAGWWSRRFGGGH